MIVFRDFEYLPKFRKIQKFLKMLKSARSSNREKLAFTRFWIKPAGGELVLDQVSTEHFPGVEYTNISRFFIFGPWETWKNQSKILSFLLLFEFFREIG